MRDAKRSMPLCSAWLKALVPLNVFSSRSNRVSPATLLPPWHLSWMCCAVEEEIYSSSRTTPIPPMLDGVVCGNECLPCCVGRQLPWYCPSLGKILCLSDSAGRTWGQRMLLEVLICLCGLETPSRSNNLSCVGCPPALFGSIRRDGHICWWWNDSTPQLYL